MSRGCQEAPSFLPRVTPTIYTFRLQTAFFQPFFIPSNFSFWTPFIPSNCFFCHYLYSQTALFLFFLRPFISLNSLFLFCHHLYLFLDVIYTFKLPFLANIFYTFLVIIDLINITLPSKRFLTFKSLATIYTFEENKSKKCLAFKLQKHRKNCECCPVSQLIVRQQKLS